MLKLFDPKNDIQFIIFILINSIDQFINFIIIIHIIVEKSIVINVVDDDDGGGGGPNIRSSIVYPAES